MTPLSPAQILVGKAVPAVLIGLLQSSVILVIIRFWFGIPMAGSVAVLYAGLLVFTLAAVGLGLSISALSLTMQQAMLYTFLLIMPLMLLSGMITPVRNMPEVLQLATYANPLRFGVLIAREVYLEGAGLADIAPALVPLVVTGGHHAAAGRLAVPQPPVLSGAGSMTRADIGRAPGTGTHGGRLGGHGRPRLS